jgi:hypothetical protein
MSGNQDQKVNKNSLLQNTIFNQLKICILGIPVVLLVSCTNTGENTQGTQEPSKNANTSVVKVINRVKCMENATSCSQDAINRIWQSCINDGYVTSLPTKQINSSRDIKELTRNITTISRSAPKLITDENGIVYSSQTEVNTSQSNIKVVGYCIGSEYIVN